MTDEFPPTLSTSCPGRYCTSAPLLPGMLSGLPAPRAHHASVPDENQVPRMFSPRRYGTSAPLLPGMLAGLPAPREQRLKLCLCTFGLPLLGAFLQACCRLSATPPG